MHWQWHYKAIASHLAGIEQGLGYLPLVDWGRRATKAAQRLSSAGSEFCWFKVQTTCCLLRVDYSD